MKNIESQFQKLAPFIAIELGEENKKNFQQILKVINFSHFFRENKSLNEEGETFRENLIKLDPKDFKLIIQKDQDQWNKYRIYASYYGKEQEWIQIDDIYEAKRKFWNRLFGFYKNTHSLIEIHLDEMEKKYTIYK